MSNDSNTVLDKQGDEDLKAICVGEIWCKKTKPSLRVRVVSVTGRKVECVTLEGAVVHHVGVGQFRFVMQPLTAYYDMYARQCFYAVSGEMP